MPQFYSAPNPAAVLLRPLQQEDLEWKQINMGLIMASAFTSFRQYGFSPDLRKDVERNPAYRNHVEGISKITMQDLAEFYLQVGGCIFSPQEKEQEADDE
jgi:hypothetical protein